ncbi:hypothetical protein SRABI05_02901 [Agrobacterium fabrum]|uniref:DUF2442 domain-containing protein n=1 Tax=Agrobacterium fabrum TaxID=1176649 RepID=UPI001D6967FC|nr:DUF2442 domain-containing protein [Agrobacterium fabrum]CAH0247642.1 hypothetical protein SRABI46_03137 [Agrobacterium fabrum]CAH0247742.1 hypothetical protein SRABI05_02901 [Agrobacterium fabrum]
MSHPPPRNVRYDRRAGTVVVEFANGSSFVVPARSLRGLVSASEREIAEVGLLGETRLYWKTLEIAFELGDLMEGLLDRPVFMRGLAKAAEEAQGGTGEPPTAAWVGPVIDFLAGNLPSSRESGWQHHFVTAYQIACETLVALGQADETIDGAVPRENPEVPAILPRYDDVAVAVIFLATQNGLITFLPSDDISQQQPLGAGNESLHQPPGYEMWAAYANPEVTSLLRLLGLLDGNEWTAASEAIFWRDSPVEWRIDFTKDSRFLDAVNDTCEQMPATIRKEIERLALIADDDILAYMRGDSEQDEEASKASVIRMPPKTREEVRATIHWIRRYDFNELFYKFWRIDEGWLTEDEAKRALEIFNDALAIAMRKAVAARLYPHYPHLAE